MLLLLVIISHRYNLHPRYSTVEARSAVHAFVVAYTIFCICYSRGCCPFGLVDTAVVVMYKLMFYPRLSKSTTQLCHCRGQLLLLLSRWLLLLLLFVSSWYCMMLCIISCTGPLCTLAMSLWNQGQLLLFLDFWNSCCSYCYCLLIICKTCHYSWPG